MIKMLGGNLNSQESRLLEQISQKACNQFADRLKSKEVITFFVPSAVLNPKRIGIIGFCMVEVDSANVGSCVCELKDNFEYGKWSYLIKEVHKVLKEDFDKDTSISIQMAVSIQLMNSAFEMVKDGVYDGYEIPKEVIAEIQRVLKKPPVITGIVEFGKKSPIQA